MSAKVTFVDTVPTQVPLSTLPQVLIPPPPMGAGDLDTKAFCAKIETAAMLAPDPLQALLYSATRLMMEAERDAKITHNGTLRNGSLAKFMASVGVFATSAKYVHATKVDAEIKGGRHEEELSRILQIANKVQS